MPPKMPPKRGNLIPQTPGGRRALAGITLSAGAFVSLLTYEGYQDKAYYATPHEQRRGIATLGFGETQGVKAGDSTDPIEALSRANSTVQAVSDGIKRCINVPMHQHEFDASVSLAYNIGIGAFCKSTVAQRFNRGDYAGACAAFSAWVFQGGQALPGLVARREKERARCEGRMP